MQRIRPRLTFANVVSVIALFIALGGTGIAASQLGKNTVGTKQLKKNAVTTAKIKKGAVTAAKVKKRTLTGAQINASTLGTVPSAQAAQTAQTANALAPPEAWHVVGAPGEPTFATGWHNWQLGEVPEPESVAFFKDREGIVHLKGGAIGPSPGLIFRLPPGYRPAAGKFINLPVFCVGTNCSGNSGVVVVYGSGISADKDGAVVGTGILVSLSGITFRAES